MMLQIEFDHRCLIEIIKISCESLKTIFTGCKKKKKISSVHNFVVFPLKALSIIIYISSILNLTSSCCQSIFMLLCCCASTVILSSNDAPIPFSRNSVFLCWGEFLSLFRNYSKSHTDLFRLIKKVLETSVEVGHFKALATPVCT